MRLLLAEDDAILGDAMVRHLRHRGYAVDWVRDGREADRALVAQVFDLVLLDLGLPRRPGLAVLSAMRARSTATPVIIVTAQDAVEERVAGLDAGADDYLVKPFALSELDARVRALIRRMHGANTSVLRHGPLAFDTVARTATIDGEPLDLSAREVAVLELLLLRVGRVVAKEQMVEHLCSWDANVSTNAIEVYVHRLRRKLEPAAMRVLTVRGLGYYVARP